MSTSDVPRSRRRPTADTENKDAEVTKDVELDAENGHDEAPAPAPTAKRTVRRPAAAADDEETTVRHPTRRPAAAADDDDSSAPAEEVKPVPRAGPKKVGVPRNGVQSAPAKRAALHRFVDFVDDGPSRPKNIDPVANEIEIFATNIKGFVKDPKVKFKDMINMDGGTSGDLFASLRAVNTAMTHINKFGHGAKSIHIADADFIAIVLSDDLKFGRRYIKTDDKVTEADEDFTPSSLQGFMTDDNGVIDSAYVSREFITDLAYLILENNADKVTKQGKAGVATRQHYSLNQNVRHLFKDLISARSGSKASPVSLSEISVTTLAKLLLDSTKPLNQEAAERDSPTSFAEIRRTVKSDSDVIDLVRTGPAKIEAQAKSAAKKAAAAK